MFFAAATCGSAAPNPSRASASARRRYAPAASSSPRPLRSRAMSVYTRHCAVDLFDAVAGYDAATGASSAGGGEGGDGAAEGGGGDATSSRARDDVDGSESEAAPGDEEARRAHARPAEAEAETRSNDARRDIAPRGRGERAARTTRARPRVCGAEASRRGCAQESSSCVLGTEFLIAAREIFQLDGGGSTFGPKFFTSPRRAPRVPRRAARQGIRAPGGVEAVVRRVVATLRSRPEAGSKTRLSRPGDDSCFSKEEKKTSGRRALGLPKRFLAAAPRRTSRPARCRPTTARPRAARRSPRSRPGRPRRRGASRTTSPCSIRSRRSSSSWSPSSNERRSSSPGSSAATTGVAA